MYVDILINNEEPEVRSKCAKFLFGLGSIGISAIVEIYQENEDLRKEIVTHLINSPLVIETILIPSLLNKFHSANHQIQNKAIVALSKLGCLSSRNETIPILLDLLKNSTLNKNLICGALRSFGDEGLQSLIESRYQTL
jgi:HEAT repeat protein